MKRLLSKMILIRTFEDKVFDVYERLLEGSIHLYAGQEAVAVGVCDNLSADDSATGGHRPHGYYIAKGGDLGKLMAELAGKEGGCCKGKGGSMHISSAENGFLCAMGLIGPGIPIAVGAGLASRLKGTRSVAIAFFGEGAQSTGSLHESLYYASFWTLPVVFVCEVNGFQSMTRADEYALATPIVDRAAGYGIPGVSVDGNDVLDVYRKARVAIQRARAGRGPSLLVCRTYRYAGHTLRNDRSGRYPTGGYRTKAELDFWLRRDPVKRLSKILLKKRILNKDEIAALHRDAEAAVENAVLLAESSPFPPPEEALADVWSQRFG